MQFSKDWIITLLTFAKTIASLTIPSGKTSGWAGPEAGKEGGKQQNERMPCVYHAAGIGYNTAAGERGGHRCGGEKQHMFIVKAIRKGSPIIILDEAANVDPENEKALVTAIDALTEEKKIFMIAYRLKPARNAI